MSLIKNLIKNVQFLTKSVQFETKDVQFLIQTAFFLTHKRTILNNNVQFKPEMSCLTKNVQFF